MANVLIIGNITRDNYLSLDPGSPHLERDHKHYWLDLPFDSSSTTFFHHTSIFGGGAITYEVLRRFSIPAEISGTTATYDNGTVSIPRSTPTTCRFILSVGTSAHYLRPTEIQSSTFTPPETSPDYIYIDRSAVVTKPLVDSLLSYLALSPHTQLVYFIDRHTDLARDYIKKLIEQSSITFSDTDHPATFRITDTSITTPTHAISWSLKDKQDLTTHLTSHSIIAATLLAATITGADQPTALLLAKYNAEGSTLSGTLSPSTLTEKTAGQNWQVRSLQSLRATAEKLLAQGKGILAADESGGSIAKKFASMNIPDDEQHRRDYRNIFFTTRDLERYASGVILFDETARQHTDDGTDFVTFLTHRGVIPGIKVDQGLDPQPSGETLTRGLDGLPTRLAEYYNMGLRFAKWRAAFQLTPTTPTEANIQQNCDILAQYARDCQVAGIVPIVEPELVYDGDYTLEQSVAATTQILKQLIASLKSHQVDLPATIVKTNMVLAGKQQPHQSAPAEVSAATATVLRTSLPDDLAGVVFLSGGQSPAQATENLAAITSQGPFPWPVTFSFARALQDPALEAWHGDNHNADPAREAFLSRLIANSAALTKK